MFINRLKISGFKGLTIDIQPELPLVELAGRNRSGKTSILEAISIATIGRHIGRCPKANTRTNAIMRSMGPATWEIQLETDLGSAAYKVTPDIITHESDLPEVSITAMESFMDLSGPNRSRALVAAVGGEQYEAELEAFLARAWSMEIPTGGETIIERAVFTIDEAKSRLKSMTAAQAAMPDLHEPSVADPDRDELRSLTAKLAGLETAFQNNRAEFQAWAMVEAADPAEEEGVTVEEARTKAAKAGRHRDTLQAMVNSHDATINASTRSLAGLPQLMEWDDSQTCETCGSAASHWTLTKEDVLARNDRTQQTATEHRRAIVEATAERDLITLDLKMANESWSEADAKLKACIRRDSRIEQREKARTTITEEVLDQQRADIDATEQDVAEKTLAAAAWDRFLNNEKLQQDLTAKIDPLKLLIKEMNAWLKDVGQRVFTDVLKPGNEIVSEALGIEFQFLKGDFVYYKKGVVIPYDGMSGAERALCGLALTIGLQLRDGAKIVFLDEFHVFNPETQQAILDALENKIGLSPELDMAWIAIPTDNDLQIDGKE